MNMFGRVDRDLELLRLSRSDLRAAYKEDSDAVEDQIDHHCMRLAWKMHVRTGAPVRNLLHVAAANAYRDLTRLVPSEEPEDDQDLLGSFITQAQRKNEVLVCFGFFLRPEYRRVCHAAVATVPGEFLASQTIFATVPQHLLACMVDRPSRLHMAHAALLKLREFWGTWEHRVATDPLTRETVRRVKAMTGDDPWCMGMFFLDGRVSFLESFIELSGVPFKAGHADVGIDRVVELLRGAQVENVAAGL